MKRAFQQKELRFYGDLKALQRPRRFFHLLDELYNKKWVVHAKRPFGGPRGCLKYLARYTHRVAISNRRLLSLADGKVRFSWKDYKTGCQQREMTLDALEFLRRFLLHVLPKRFVRIRHYGFLSAPSPQGKS